MKLDSFPLIPVYREAFCKVAVVSKVAELRRCQEELTHAKPAHRPSGYSRWNVLLVCGDLSQHRK